MSSYGTLFKQVTKLGGSAPTKRRYFNAHHREKMKARGNLERAIAVPLEEGNWQMAVSLMSKKYRLAGLSATHIQKALAVAATNLRLIQQQQQQRDGGSLKADTSLQQNTNGYKGLPAKHRELADTLEEVKGRCVEGTLPNSAGLWTQIVFLQTQMGMVEEAWDSAQMAVRCCSSAPISAEKAKQNANSTINRPTWGSRVGGSTALSPSPAPSSDLTPTIGLSYATRLAMGELLLPVAAKQGKLDIVEEVAKELIGVDLNKVEQLPVSGTTSGPQRPIAQAEVMVRRWAAEACARSGQTERAIRLMNSLEANSNGPNKVASSYVAEDTFYKELQSIDEAIARGAVTERKSTIGKEDTQVYTTASVEQAREALKGLSRQAVVAMFLSESNAAVGNNSRQASGVPTTVLVEVLYPGLLRALGLMARSELHQFHVPLNKESPPPLTKKADAVVGHYVSSLIQGSKVAELRAILNAIGAQGAANGNTGSQWTTGLVLLNKALGLTSSTTELEEVPTDSSAAEVPSFFDQQCVDIVFAMMPVPPPRETFIRWESELRAEAHTKASLNKSVPQGTGSDPRAISAFTIRYLDQLLYTCDSISVSVPMAKVAASALLNLDTTRATLKQFQNNDAAGEDPSAGSENWRRAMLLIKNSPINNRRKSTQQASPPELEVARMIVLLHRYGPTPECRADAIKLFPHLFPKIAVLKEIEGSSHSDAQLDAVVKDLLKSSGEAQIGSPEVLAAPNTSGDDLWEALAESAKVNSIDDGTRPSDSEYDMLRAFHTHQVGKLSSSSDGLPINNAHFSFEASRRGVDHYLRHSIARSNANRDAFDPMMRKIKNDQLRMAESGFMGAEGPVDNAQQERNALGTMHSSSTVPQGELDRYWPKHKDENEDPRPAPIGVYDKASGWAMGGLAVHSRNRKSVANVMWPKHMKMLGNPMRSWKQSNPRHHAENVRKWNGKSSM